MKLHLVGKSHGSWDMFYRRDYFYFSKSFKFLAFFMKPHPTERRSGDLDFFLLLFCFKKVNKELPYMNSALSLDY